MGRILLLTCVAAMASAGHLTAGMMYWTDSGSIYRASLDGAGVQQVYTGNPTVGSANYVDIDPITGKLFSYGRVGTIESGYGYIRRSNLDGTGLEDVIGSGLRTLQYGFALDSTNRTMYFGSHGAAGRDAMFKANLDGSNLEVLPPHPYYPHDMAVDSTNAKLYYTDAILYDGIKRANLDGTNVENVVNHGGSSGGSNVGTFIALDVAGDQLYYSRSELGQIFRSNLDGSNQQLLFSGITDVYDVELDASAGKLYWTSRHKVQRGNIDGSGLEDLVTLSGTSPWTSEGFVLDLRSDVSPVPEPSSMALLAIGALSFAGIGIRRKGRVAASLKR